MLLKKSVTKRPARNPIQKSTDLLPRPLPAHRFDPLRCLGPILGEVMRRRDFINPGVRLGKRQGRIPSNQSGTLARFHGPIRIGQRVSVFSASHVLIRD